MARKRWHGGRSMLNRRGHQSTANIVAEVENTAQWRMDDRPHWDNEPEVTLHIADCDRKISFDFAFESAEDRSNNLYKVDTMIRRLTDFREALEIEQQRYIERIRRLSD